MTHSPPPPRRRSLFWTVWLLAGAALLAAYFIWKPDGSRPDGQPADPVAAAQASARGVGHMEQFDFVKAVAAFEEAAKFAPDWRPARINLGIALLNTQIPADLDRALSVFAEILKEEPDNLHALYCSGIIHLDRNDIEPAHRFFTRVTELDPSDAHAWYYRGRTRPNEPSNPDAKKDYETALSKNPYLNAARYALAQHGHERDEKQTLALLTQWEQLGEKGADWEDVAKVEYIYMGRYAEVIGASPAPPPAGGPLPLFAHIRLPAIPGAVAAAEADPLTKAVWNRFGLAVTLLDYDRDGRPDVFLPGTRPVLLRNDGNNAFKDVTAELGLDKLTTVFGVAAADFDNDGRTDLLFTGPAGLRLFRNVDGKRFEDRTAEGGLDGLKGVCLGATWADLDQDGDLDLIVAVYADTPENAVKRLAAEQGDGGGRLVVFANVGVAPPVPPGQNLPPISCKFHREDWPDQLRLTGPLVAVVATDIDGDKDVDLIALGDGGAGGVVLNDRLMRFRRLDLKDQPAARPNGGLLLDATVEDPSDRFTIAAGEKPLITLGKRTADGNPPGSTDSPPLVQAHRADLDQDGRADVVGISADGKLVFLHGDGAGKLASRPGAFGPAADALPGLAGVAVADLDGDGPPDLLAVAADGLHLFRNLGNGSRGLRLAVTGRRHKGESLRTNADAVGAKVIALAGPVRAGAELTTLTAGLGQSRLPLHLGLGDRAATADAVRLRWPDQVVQAELNQPTDRIVEIVETKRNQGSCPILFTWDGRHFAYIADFLGGGAVGEMGPDGSVRPPRPEESVKIEANQLALKDGKYIVKVSEPMDEVMYLDHLRLVAIDHPKDVVAFPDERFATADPQPTQELLAFRERFAPVRATDHRGRDVTAKLRHRDRDAVDQFAVRSWLGFAEEHWVELEFGAAAKNLTLRPPSLGGKGEKDKAPPLLGEGLGRGSSTRLFLVLAGATEYAYPESIYAAGQAGVPMLPPVLEQRQPDGTWNKLDDLGFPAGLMRVMTKDVTGLLDPAGGPIRIRTNLRIYWDQVFLAPLAGPGTLTVSELPVARADLAYAGFAQEITPGGKPPVEYDHDRREVVSVTPWKGRLTRFGDVTELLAATDDLHAIAGPGDEVTAEFDAASLPPLPAGWVRSFVLRTAGYCKDTAPTTASGGRVGPVPYRGMPAYPYDEEKVPPHLAEYDRKWNTRPANGEK